MSSSGTDRVLFVSPGPSLATPESGEGRRLQQLSRQLADSWDIVTLVPTDVAGQSPDWVSRQYTYDQWSIPFLTDLNPWFVRSLWRVLSNEDVDVVHVSTGACAARLVRVLDGDTRVVHAAQNVEADHAKDFVNPDLPVYKRFLGPRLIPLIERATVHCADGVTTVSEKDRERFIERYGIEESSIEAIPTGTEAVDVDDLDSPASVRERYGLSDAPIAVFHGYYDHPPNREAAEIIDQHVAPALENRGLDIEFLLVGKGAPAISSSNVHAVGFVDDLFAVLNAADVAVVPIQHGGGTKTKMYDYVSLGLPIVATEKATEGIDLEDGRHAIVTSTVDQKFVDGIEAVSTDEDLADRLSENLRQLAVDWSWERSAKNLDQFYRSLDRR